MATSGSASSRVDSTGYIQLRLSWQQLSQDVGANRTRIRLTLQVVTNQYGAMYGSASLPWSINCEGSNGGSWTIQTGANTTRTIGTRDVDIYHNADGTKSFSASASATFNMNFNGWVGSVGVSVSGTLNTIARASQPSIITWPNTTTDIGDIGKTVTIHMNRASGSFTHTVRYNFQGLSGTIATGVTENTSWTIPTSFNNKVVNGTSASGTVEVDTYNGGTKIGTKSVSFTVHVPASIVPTISSVSVVDDSGYYSKYGGYVQAKSELRATIQAAGAYGSTIKSVTSTINGRSITGTSIGIGTVDISGSTQLTTKVTDSRGRTASKTTTLNFLAYSAPKFTSVTATRTPTSESSTVRLALRGSTTNLGNKNTNTATVTIERRQQGQSTWTQVNSANRGISWNYTYDMTNMTSDMPWEVRISATDQLGTVTRTIISVATDEPILDFKADGTGVAVGTIAMDPETFDIGWRQHMLAPRYFSACNIGTSMGYMKMCSISFKNNAAPCDCTCRLTFVQRRRVSDVYLMFEPPADNTSMRVLWTSQCSFRAPDENAKMYYDIADNRCDIWVSQTTSYDRIVLADVVSDPVYGASHDGPLVYSLSTEWSATLPETAVEIGRHIFLENSGVTIGGANGLTIHNGALNWVSSQGLTGMVGKKLWSGRANRGAVLTVPDLDKYNMFAIAVFDDWQTYLGVRSQNGKRLVAGPNDADGSRTYARVLRATLEGTKFTLDQCGWQEISAGAPHPWTNDPIVGIYGVI